MAGSIDLRRLYFTFVVLAMLATLAGCEDDATTGQPQHTLAAFNACAATAHPARRTNHDILGQLDHCYAEADFLQGWTLLTNWGTKPEWLTRTSFVFVSNLVGDVYRMEIESGEIERLTGHFPHAGFTRVHVLANDDLLLLGPSSGPQPPLEPLVAYDEGMFTGDLFVLRHPYDGVPLPLGRNAWEGLAVSRDSMQIAWSTSAEPFYALNADGELDLAATATLYLSEPSEIRTGAIVYDSMGVPAIEDERVVISKADVGSVFLEPQDFVGTADETLLVSAYGIVDGVSDALIVDMSDGAFERIIHPFGTGYDEWEGVHPERNVTFVEIIDGPLFPFPGGYLFLYDFDTQEFTEVVGIHSTNPHEPVFSQDGRWALTATLANGGWPGYSAGILLIDMTPFLDAQE